jgi:hypothetical protein
MPIELHLGSVFAVVVLRIDDDGSMLAPEFGPKEDAPAAQLLRRGEVIARPV